MRRFGMLTIAAGVWVGGVAHAQDVDPHAHGAVAGGIAALGPPPPPPAEAEPSGPDLPVAVGISAGVATFLPGGGKPAGGVGAPPSQGGAGGGGGGGSGGGGTAPGSDGLPLIPAPTPSLTDNNPGGPTPAEELPSVGGPQDLDPTPNFFFPPPPPPPPPDEEPPPVGGGGGGGTDTDPPGQPGPIVESPEPGTLALAGIGVAGALGWRRRRRA